MKETETKWKRAFSLFIGLTLAATFVLASLNLRNYYLAHWHYKDEKVMEKKVKPVKLDTARFEVEVVKLHKSMRDEFPDHPEMIIKKLYKIVEKEENR